MQDWLSFKLPQTFIEKYVDVEPKWGFSIGGGNTLGELTYISKYSRKKDEAIGYDITHEDYGKKERWYETCRRCIEGAYTILKNHCTQNRTPWNEIKAQKSAQAAFDRMFEFKWMPPGRGLANMGTIMVHEENNSATLQNCFIGSELFLAEGFGPSRFDEFVGQEVRVWAKGKWNDAEIKSFGEQEVQRVTFSPAHAHADSWRAARSNVRLTVTVTPNHRWVLVDGTDTTELAVGHYVPASVPISDLKTADHYEGLIHGLIFGDGVKITHRYANGDYGFELRACDERTKNLIKSDLQVAGRFDKVNWDRPSANGDPICIKRSSINMKDFPDGSSTPDYMNGFIRGWITADASIDGSTYRLASQHQGAENWLSQWAAYAGYVMTGSNVDSVMTTNFGSRSNSCKRFTLRDDIHNLAWKVVNIDSLPEQEPVYCAVVPDIHEFTLASGVNTGNCAFVSTGRISSRSVREATLPFERIMEMSMNGVGVGFDVRGAGKITIHEPNVETVDYVIEDTREAWSASLSVLLESYFFENRPTVIFDYSNIRPKGAPLKRFGGTASGPDPLQFMHDQIREIFSGRDGQLITETDIADIGNLAGRAAVAGGARRSAEIILGPDNSEEFINLKNKDINPVRNGLNVDKDGNPAKDENGNYIYNEDGGWANLSNNSIIAEVGKDYSYLVDSIATNGEPGLIYMDLIRDYGRLGDAPDYKDHRVAGVNPCSEQSLEHMELCCLVETYPYHHETYEDYRETLKAAYLYAKAVTLMPTIWPESNEVMQRNRRIGTSISGVAQFVEHRGIGELRDWLTRGYDFICHRDSSYSEWLGIRESIKKTSIKPSGTVSILAGATPGKHWPEFVTYIRRVRFMNSDPMIDILVAAGYTAEPDVMDPKNTVVVSYPTLGPEVRSQFDVSVWEKAHMAAMLQRYWADNQVSATLTFKESEKDQIGPILANFDGQLKSISLLPLLEDSTTYPQMPYEARPREEIALMLGDIKRIDTSMIYDSTDSSQAEGEKFCSNDTCEITFAPV